MLGQKMDENPDVNVWLVNTGWTGGAYGTGHRMKLGYTRSMVTAALNGELADVSYTKHPVFGVEVPASVPNVPAEILDPRNTWADKEAYDRAAIELAEKFVRNFQKYAAFASEEILAGAPKVPMSLSV